MNELTPYTEIQLLRKLLEQEVGYERAQELIERAKYEYTMILNSSKI